MRTPQQLKRHQRRHFRNSLTKEIRAGQIFRDHESGGLPRLNGTLRGDNFSPLILWQELLVDGIVIQPNAP